jgi:hypothetical protein
MGTLSTSALVDLVLQLEDEVAVLRVHGADRAECLCRREAVHERFVVAHDGVLVRHEVLEAVDAVLSHQRDHVLANALVPPGDRDVERIVRAGLLRPAAPVLPCVHDPLSRIRDHEINDHRGAAGKSRRSAGEKVVARHGAHERQLHVRVRVDAARHHVLPAGIDHGGARRRVQLLADRSDLAVDAQHVGAEGLVGGDDRAALYEDCHRSDLSSVVHFLAGSSANR